MTGVQTCALPIYMQPGDFERKFSGLDLKVGGSGMKAFYDKIIPEYLNKFGKKYGARVGKTQIQTEPGQMVDVHHFPITDAMRQEISREGVPMYASGGSIAEMKSELLGKKGQYGARRLERALDEIPNLAKMYSPEALRGAFFGDNAKALMTMNPADFEKYAYQLRLLNQVSPSQAKAALSYGSPKDSMPTDEYIRHLAALHHYEDVPYLNIDKEEQGLPITPFITGHEGRHRSRAMAHRGDLASLVQLLPRAELRETLPRYSQEEYIDALRKELAMTNNMVIPEGKLERRAPVKLPEVYKDGGSTSKGTDMPTLAQMKFALQRFNTMALKDVGVNEAPDMNPKMFMAPDQIQDSVPPPGGVAMSSGMPVGGIDANRQIPGQQLMPPPAPMQQQRPGQPPQGQQAPGQAPGQQPPSAGPSAPGQMGNMLNLTPQGQTMSALQPQRMADGGEVEYRGEHAAPGPHFGAPMHDVTRDIYPKDFYGPNGFRYYSDHGDDYDRDAHNKVLRVRNKPEEKVWIHRAIPLDVYKEAMQKETPLKHMIIPGDWVAISKQYAKDHGESVLHGKYKVASMRVPAKHVWTNGDSIHEWGYHPEEKSAGGKVAIHKNLDTMRYEMTMKRGK